MYGGDGDPGTLNVYVQRDGEVGKHRIWTKSGGQVTLSMMHNVNRPISLNPLYNSVLPM